MSKSLGVPKRPSMPADSEASKSGSVSRKKVQFRDEERSLQQSGKKDSMREDSIDESIQLGKDPRRLARLGTFRLFVD